MRGTTLVIAITCALVTAAHAETPDEQVLALINARRAEVGLPAVALDPKLSKGCMKHADYMKQNRGSEAMEGLNAHTERMNLPGATKEGAACGKAADLFPGVTDFGSAVEGWMAGIYHRRPILDPGLQKIGFGYAKLPDGTYMAALMFDQPPGSAKSGWPVAYPADGAAAVPLEYGNEVPNPVPQGKGGYPLTLQFPPFDKVTGVSAKLVDSNGKAVSIFLSDPEHPATSFGQFGVVSVIAQQPLRDGTKYRIEIAATWQGKHQTWKWSFETLARRAIDAGDFAAVNAALGAPSRVRGTVKYGGMMDTQTAFLVVGGKGEKLVSVLVPLAVWKQLGRDAPERWKGTQLEVEATPQLVQNRFINLAIANAAQLRIVYRPRT